MGNQSAFSWPLLVALCSTIQVPQPEAQRCPLKKVAQGFIKLICHGMFISRTLSELPAQVVLLSFGIMIESNLSKSCGHIVSLALATEIFTIPVLTPLAPAPSPHSNNSFGGDEPRSRKLDSSRIRQRPRDKSGHATTSAALGGNRQTGLKVEALGGMVGCH